MAINVLRIHFVLDHSIYIFTKEALIPFEKDRSCDITKKKKKKKSIIETDWINEGCFVNLPILTNVVM